MAHYVEDWLKGKFEESLEILDLGKQAAKSAAAIAKELIGAVPILGGLVKGVIAFIDRVDVYAGNVKTVMGLQSIRESIVCEIYCFLKGQTVFDDATAVALRDHLSGWLFSRPPHLAAGIPTLWGQGYSAWLGAVSLDEFKLRAFLGGVGSDNDCAVLCVDCANESTVVVPANGWGDGNGFDTLIDVTSGQTLTITCDAGDTWFMGTIDTNAAGVDEFGSNFVYSVQGTYGALIGRIGLSGPFFLVGLSYSATANASGRLYLMANDAPYSVNYADNSGDIAAVVSLV
jgi:hypothetical protein